VTIRDKKNNFALVFFGLVLSLLIVEGLLRFLGWGFLYIQEKGNRQPAINKTVKIENTGDRQIDQAVGKEVVVLCIGESTTAGTFTGFQGKNNLWPRQLERILNNIQDEKKFYIINKGMSGKDTNDIISHFPGWLKEYKPNFVLAMIGINDGTVEPFSEKTSSSQTRSKTLFSHFRTFGLIEWIVAGITVRITGKSKAMATTDLVGKHGTRGNLTVYGLRHPNVTNLYPKTIRNLNDMVSLATDQGIEFGFVQYALRKTDILRNVIEGDVFYISNYEIFSDLLKQYKFVDLFYDDFAGDFGHATPFGNKIIADNVARQLLKHPKLQRQSN